jgi:putative flippase GtrA
MSLERLRGFATKALRHQLVRFLAVGAVNTLFSYGVYVFLIWLGLHFALATLLQIIASIFFNYLTFGNLVFTNPIRGAPWRFALVCIGQYALYTMGLWILIQWKLSKYLAGAVMIGPVVVMSYLLNKHFAFRAKSRKMEQHQGL